MSIQRLNRGPRMSQAVIHGGVVYTSGQVDGSAPDVTTQTKNTLAKVEALLQQAGSNKTQILSANIWLSDISEFAEMNEVWESWIAPGAAPARATVQSQLAGPQYKVEIAVIAAVAARKEP